MWREGETDNEYRTQEGGGGMGVCSVDGEAGGSRAGTHSDTQNCLEKKAPNGRRGASFNDRLLRFRHH